jgi:hypothetical protein
MLSGFCRLKLNPVFGGNYLGRLIHGGAEGYTREGVRVFPWQAVNEEARASAC